MTQPIHLIAEIYCMLIPEGAEGFEISIQDDGIPCLTYWYKDILEPTVICLPPGNWQIICTTKEITEEWAKGIVRELPIGQRWHNYNGDYPVWWHSAKESLKSLLTSKGLDLAKNYILIKKLN